MTSKSEMFTELCEFFETFSEALLLAKIDYKHVEKYLYQRRGVNETTDIYKWVFTVFMKEVKKIHDYLRNYDRDTRVRFEVTESPEYSYYYHTLANIKKMWGDRPWKV